MDLIAFMSKIKPLLTRPLERHLHSAVSCFAERTDISTLFSSLDKEKYLSDTGQIVNGLSGNCVLYSDQIEEYLRKRHSISLQYAHSKLRAVHTFLTSTTRDSGELIVDPTLGQFVEYPTVFVGTEHDLRTAFMDQNRRFLCGRRLWAVKHDIILREEWFELLYQR